MFITVEGVYRNNKVELLTVPEGIATDESVERPVLVTFLSPITVNLQASGITEAQAAELRTRLATFAEDCSNADLDGYDQYEVAHLLQLPTPVAL